MPSETIKGYVARKKAKGTWRQPKPHTFEGRQVLTGVCPCTRCGHEGREMIRCDAERGDCQCCSEVCS